MPATSAPIAFLAVSLTWIEAALVIFFVVFVLITLRVLLARRGRYDDSARLPLEDDRIVTPRHSQQD